MTTKNWPDPNRPGVPMFPDRSGKHAVGGKLLFWYSDIQKWVTSSPISATKEPNYFAECEYHGPVLIPTQINEMLAAERDRAAKAAQEVSDTYYEQRQEAESDNERIYADERMCAAQECVEAIRNLGAPMRPLSEMLEHEIANEKIRLFNLPESEQTDETENRLAEILDWEDER